MCSRQKRPFGSREYTIYKVIISIFNGIFLFQLNSFDMIIAVQGLGGGNVATYMSKGRDFPRQNYNSGLNNQMLPYKESTPYFGQGPDHHIALNNGGMKIASLVA